MLTRATFPSADMYLTARYGKFVDSGFRSSPLVHRAIAALFTAAERWLPAVTRIADLILQRGGAYQLAVKENQGQLYQDLNDIAFREDESSVRKDHAPENLAVLRHIALNLLKQEKTAHLGIHAKRLQAGCDQAYLLQVLAA